ncbi:MAG TPA: hydroxymethylbilane synthase [Candidatus Wallbacteria bacterium]|nr:hydroxymethylbilane synthase [Candidatus Wallbacteria bacterium]
MSKIIIATRKSPLAIWQAEHVREILKKNHPGNDYEFLEIVTEGDKMLDSSLAKIGGKGLFVKDIENAVIEGRADLAVHSAKDMPVEMTRKLYISAVMKREDPFDALITRDKKRLVDLAKGASIGTSSMRRKAQLLYQRPDLKIVELRGNVNTRLKKLDEGQYDAIVLACASVKRMGWGERISQILDDRIIVPCCGQGALAIESRRGDKNIDALVKCLNDVRSFLEVEAERTFLARLNGGCQMPVGVYCEQLSDGRFHMTGAIFDPEGKTKVEGTRVGIKNVIVGFELANELLDGGGKRILDAIER